MIRKDFFLKLLQQLDEVIRRVNGLRRENKEEEALQEIHSAYSNLLGLNAEALPEGIHPERLQDAFSLNLQQMDVLARLLYQEGSIYHDLGSGQQAQSALALSLEIYQYLNREEKVFSFEREACIADLQQLLAN